jgi:uncharacterized protein YjbI with pentapeptide repeats
MPLVLLVTIGTVTVTGAGLALFLWLAWLLSRQPAPLRGESGWWDWLAFADGSAIFDAARTTATILAVVGIGGAALVSYRRQDTAERGQQIANAQHALDSQKYELDRNRHELELQRRKDEQERELRARFSSVAQQLGAKDYTVRHAGAYSLASLADDWHTFGNNNERQVCIDLLCAQLRTPLRKQVDGLPTSDELAEDTEVRKTMMTLLKTHRPLQPDSASWTECSIDLSGAELVQSSFYEIDLSNADLSGANLKGANFMRMNLTKANLFQAHLSSADFSESNLTGARLWNVRVSKNEEQYRFGPSATFNKAVLRGALFLNSYLPKTDFSGADLTDAQFQSASLGESLFNRARLSEANLRRAKLTNSDFSGADLRGADFAGADIAEILLADAIHDETTVWPDGFTPPKSAPFPPEEKPVAPQ